MAEEAGIFLNTFVMDLFEVFEAIERAKALIEDQSV